MKQTRQETIGRPMKVISIGLAMLMVTSAASGQAPDADTIRRLQEENAALRRQLAELKGQPAPATPAAPAERPAPPSATAPTTAPSRATVPGTDEEEAIILSPFQVDESRDYGYLKTNAATATRIGMEIQKVPINVSVISREFLEDTNAREMTDLLRYSAAASSDTRFKMRVPANEATPQGAFTLRGFQINTIMRNGVHRYISHGFDNVERVEMVKGPASVFFGQGYPGGVINFITKRPVFGKVPTSLSYQMDSYGGGRVLIDHNSMLTKQAAIRFVGGWEDTKGERRFEFSKSLSASPSFTLIPFEDGKVQITLEAEYSQKRYNRNDYDWIWSDFTGWKAAAAAGPFLASTIAANAGNGLAANVVQSTTTPTLTYATYINSKRTSTGNLFLPAYTKVERGAYYTNAGGSFIYDNEFNYTSRGAYSDEKNTIVSATLEAAPFEWLDARYVYTNDRAVHNSVGQGGALTTPYADGIHWNVGFGNRSGYWRHMATHNLDLVFKFDLWGTKNKILTGYQESKWFQQYLGGAAQSDINLAFLPGARNTTSNPDYAGTNRAKYDFGGVPVNQILYDRYGAIKPVRQIYNNYDPGVEIAPDINAYFQDDRNALDGYKPKLTGKYINYQGSFLDERLVVLAGYREENRVEKYQVQTNNDPWFVYPVDEFMWMDPVKYPQDVWGHSIAYQKTIPLDQTGRSWMLGASYSITPALTAYASTSKIFKFNSGNIGGYFPGDEAYLAQGLLAQYQSIGQSGFSYRGQTVTSVSQFQQIIEGLRYHEDIPNEEGMNYEVGLKYAANDQKIVGTFSIFSANRANRKEDDGVAQTNLNEPLNYNTDVNIMEGVRRAILLGATYSNPGAHSGRLFRVRAYENKVKVEGAEAEVVWTPIPNFQAVINGSWLPTAKLVEDSRPIYAKPGSAGYQILTVTQKRDADILWGARIENVPEYRFNIFGKYTFTENFAGDYGRGLSIGLGLRYSSETVVSRSVDWNPLAGGYQAGDYIVTDLTVAYPWELLGVKIRSNIGIYNLFDAEYSEGSFAMSPARNWVFSNSVQF